MKGKDNVKHLEQEKVLQEIKTVLKLKPMENPYEYVKAVQEQFDNCHCEIKFSNEYYDTHFYSLFLKADMVETLRNDTLV